MSRAPLVTLFLNSSCKAHMNGLRQLGWPHYWLLTAILGSLLAILSMVLLAGPLLR